MTVTPNVSCCRRPLSHEFGCDQPEHTWLRANAAVARDRLTRDGEIIPFVKAGKKDDAKALAKGVQAERFKKMQELLTALGAK